MRTEGKKETLGPDIQIPTPTLPSPERTPQIVSGARSTESDLNETATSWATQ